MPIETSSAILPFLLVASMPRATVIVYRTAVKSGFIPVKNPIATPPKDACEIPAPMNDIFLRTMKTEIMPVSMLIRIPAMNAFCIKGDPIASIIVT